MEGCPGGILIMATLNTGIKGTSMSESMSGWQRLQTFFLFSTQLFKNSQSIHAFSRCPQPWHFILSANWSNLQVGMRQLTTIC